MTKILVVMVSNSKVCGLEIILFGSLSIIAATKFGANTFFNTTKKNS